jgi:hypothetical protein
MKSSIKYLIKVFATGFIVLTLLCLLLFWVRWLCEAKRLNILTNFEATRVELKPSGIFPDEIENDPCVVSHSRFTAQINNESIFSTLGLMDYFIRKQFNGRNSIIYEYSLLSEKKDWLGLYFNKDTGLLVFRHPISEKGTDGVVKITRVIEHYAGPNGISDKPDKNIGRFSSPVVGNIFHFNCVLYDKTMRRFIKIDYNSVTVTKGPQLAKDNTYKPAAIDNFYSNPDFINVSWQAPSDSNKTINSALSLFNSISHPQAPYSLVIDQTGRIDLLDRKTLEFAGVAGNLMDKSDNLLDYQIQPFTLRIDNKYKGMFLATLNRQGTQLSVELLDEKGQIIAQKFSEVPELIMTRNAPDNMTRGIYFGLPWLPTLTITKYLLENLHPPILSIASFFTAESIDASTGHRAIFLLPNSFIAMKARDGSWFSIETYGGVFLLLFPSMLLTIFLAWRVARDAVTVGLSDNTRFFWMLGIFAFGLAGYITYRLCRPGITLVTCPNCGKPRRPDMEKCHRCKSGWYVPELVPPTWRILENTHSEAQPE